MISIIVFQQLNLRIIHFDLLFKGIYKKNPPLEKLAFSWYHTNVWRIYVYNINPNVTALRKDGKNVKS